MNEFEFRGSPHTYLVMKVAFINLVHSSSLSRWNANAMEYKH